MAQGVSNDTEHGQIQLWFFFVAISRPVPGQPRRRRWPWARYRKSASKEFINPAPAKERSLWSHYWRQNRLRNCWTYPSGRFTIRLGGFYPAGIKVLGFRRDVIEAIMEGHSFTINRLGSAPSNDKSKKYFRSDPTADPNRHGLWIGGCIPPKKMSPGQSLKNVRNETESYFKAQNMQNQAGKLEIGLEK